MEIVLIGPGDGGRVRAAGHLFDGPPQDDAVESFLADDRHHLFVAYEEELPVGFVFGVALALLLVNAGRVLPQRDPVGLRAAGLGG